MSTVTTGTFDTLPVVTFYNVSLSQRSVWVCRTTEEARSQAARLDRMPHITDVETMDAPVKG